ncbi:MAG: PAS domain S-box protein [Rhodopseudomonas sp.]|nr:PAS domain S-box protein [Rhodopseudomonas sp.]
MRINKPISNVEYEFDGSRSLYSTTDLKGRITHANPYFIEVSGFAEDELIGQPHNIVRHPDMPIAAFADLWTTIKSGLPWTAMVKNRRKNGDFYWVQATVTPILENGIATGFISVRTKPTREQIAEAAQLYSEENANPGHLILRRGRVIKSGWPSRLREACRFSIGQRIAMTQSSVLVLTGVIGWMAWRNGGDTGDRSNVMLAVTALTMIAIAAFWYFLARKVVSPIMSATKAAQGIAGGDLIATINSNRNDEIGKLACALRQVSTNLHCVIGDIRENFSTMQSATRALVTGNGNLSARTDSQAASLEQTAASMEELASTVQKNAESTNQARDVASNAMTTASKGGHTMRQVVATMNEISESSKKIADIVGIINGIATQTNLLALNAAVEAARAGEAGRGFAVVATEVRGLAQRSAEAAKDIKYLIENSVEKINAGAILSRDAGAIMEDIIASVNQATGIMVEISSASAEQSTGISQVTDAVSQMDDVTQQNAALVEVASTATADLEDQCRKLMRALAAFKLNRKPPSPATTEKARMATPPIIIHPACPDTDRTTTRQHESHRLKTPRHKKSA